MGMLVYWGERKEMICENESEMMGWRRKEKDIRMELRRAKVLYAFARAMTLASTFSVV